MPSTERGARSFLKNISEFSIRLHNAIITSPDYENKNVALSPFSLHTLFALIFWGTRGNCSKELGKAINVEDIDRNTVSSYYEHLSKSFADIAGKVFQEAIKIFLRQPYYFDIEFEEITNLFRTKNEVMDFFYGQAPILTIDSWVKDNTNCKVNDIMSGSTIGLQSELIAVVGNYFNGIWDQRFEKAKVDSGTFWLTNNESIETEMISVAGSFGYMRIEDLEAEVLVLPYENQQMSLLIIMPATADGIDDLEKNLQCEHIFNVINSATEQMIDVKLPRCRVEFKASMQPIMEKLQVLEIWQPCDNDYSVTYNEKGCGMQTIHQCIFEIEPPPTTSENSSQDTVKKIVRDYHVRRPFMFVLCWSETILMMGCLRAPVALPRTTPTDRASSPGPSLQVVPTPEANWEEAEAVVPMQEVEEIRPPPERATNEGQEGSASPARENETAVNAPLENELSGFLSELIDFNCPIFQRAFQASPTFRDFVRHFPRQHTNLLTLNYITISFIHLNSIARAGLGRSITGDFDEFITSLDSREIASLFETGQLDYHKLSPLRNLLFGLAEHSNVLEIREPRTGHPGRDILRLLKEMNRMSEINMQYVMLHQRFYPAAEKPPPAKKFSGPRDYDTYFVSNFLYKKRIRRQIFVLPPPRRQVNINRNQRVENMDIHRFGRLGLPRRRNLFQWSRSNRRRALRRRSPTNVNFILNRNLGRNRYVRSRPNGPENVSDSSDEEPPAAQRGHFGELIRTLNPNDPQQFQRLLQIRQIQALRRVAFGPGGENVNRPVRITTWQTEGRHPLERIFDGVTERYVLTRARPSDYGLYPPNTSRLATTTQRAERPGRGENQNVEESTDGDQSPHIPQLDGPNDYDGQASTSRGTTSSRNPNNNNSGPSGNQNQASRRRSRRGSRRRRRLNRRQLNSALQNSNSSDSRGSEVDNAPERRENEPEEEEAGGEPNIPILNPREPEVLGAISDDGEPENEIQQDNRNVGENEGENRDNVNDIIDEEYIENEEDHENDAVGAEIANNYDFNEDAAIDEESDEESDAAPTSPTPENLEQLIEELELDESKDDDNENIIEYVEEPPPIDEIPPEDYRNYEPDLAPIFIDDFDFMPINRHNFEDEPNNENQDNYEDNGHRIDEDRVYMENVPESPPPDRQDRDVRQPNGIYVDPYRNQMLNYYNAPLHFVENHFAPPFPFAVPIPVPLPVQIPNHQHQLIIRPVYNLPLEFFHHLHARVIQPQPNRPDEDPEPEDFPDDLHEAIRISNQQVEAGNFDIDYNFVEDRRTDSDYDREFDGIFEQLYLRHTRQDRRNSHDNN